MLSRNARFRTFFAIAAACASIGAAGCMHNTTLVSAPVTAPPQPASERPMNVAPDTDASPPHAAAPAPPRIAEDVAPPPLAEIIAAPKMPIAPPKPSNERSASQHEPESVDHTPAPQIVPQMSPSEQQNYERQASTDASVAQDNLVRAEERQLNGTQRDLRDKVLSFLKQSREAGKAGDWIAAQNFAQKARLLSVQLLNTL